MIETGSAFGIVIGLAFLILAYPVQLIVKSRIEIYSTGTQTPNRDAITKAGRIAQRLTAIFIGLGEGLAGLVVTGEMLPNSLLVTVLAWGFGALIVLLLGLYLLEIAEFNAWLRKIPAEF